MTEEKPPVWTKIFLLFAVLYAMLSVFIYGRMLLKSYGIFGFSFGMKRALEDFLPLFSLVPLFIVYNKVSKKPIRIICLLLGFCIVAMFLPPRDFRVSGILQALAPPTIFYLTYLAFTRTKNLALMQVGTILCVIVLVITFILGSIFYHFHRETASHTEPTYYAKALERFHEKYLLEHFPENIQEDAELVKLYFKPAFIRGGDELQLRLKLTKSEIETKEKDFQEKAYVVFETASEYYDADLPRHYSTVFFKTGDTGDFFEKFSDDFKIMILDDILPDSKNSRWCSWDAHGVAISKKHNEIVYWAEWSN